MRNHKLGLPGKGSSPLTRGKHTASLSGCEIERLIPAHAGKTLPWQFRRVQTSAHPRSRGENVTEENPPVVDSGSSPLTRGKLREAVLGHVAERLIPAHAGKTAA